MGRAKIDMIELPAEQQWNAFCKREWGSAKKELELSLLTGATVFAVHEFKDPQTGIVTMRVISSGNVVETLQNICNKIYNPNLQENCDFEFYTKEDYTKNFGPGCRVQFTKPRIDSSTGQLKTQYERITDARELKKLPKQKNLKKVDIVTRSKKKITQKRDSDGNTITNIIGVQQSIEREENKQEATITETYCRVMQRKMKISFENMKNSANTNSLFPSLRTDNDGNTNSLFPSLRTDNDGNTNSLFPSLRTDNEGLVSNSQLIEGIEPSFTQLPITTNNHSATQQKLIFKDYQLMNNQQGGYKNPQNTIENNQEVENIVSILETEETKNFSDVQSNNNRFNIDNIFQNLYTDNQQQQQSLSQYLTPRYQQLQQQQQQQEQEDLFLPD